MTTNASSPDRIDPKIVKLSENVRVDGGKANMLSRGGKRCKEEKQTRSRMKAQKEEESEEGAQEHKHRNPRSGEDHRSGQKILGN